MARELSLSRVMEAALEDATAHVLRGGGGPFGAVVVDATGIPVAAAPNLVTTTPDPTAHAEVTALRRAALVRRSHDLSGHTVVTTCEPCPMCLAACMWARIDRVVFAADRADAAAAGFDDQAFYEAFGMPPVETEVQAGPLTVVRLLTWDGRPFPKRLAPFEAWARYVGRVTY